MSSVYIISDIEGSSLCGSKGASQLFNGQRYVACKGLTQDINAVCSALFAAGVKRIGVKDFHRTGYNILPKFLDKRVELDQGYYEGPIVGIGAANGFDYVMMVGLHAASGTDGFLPHTLTSQFARLEVNGRALTEAELFCSSVSGVGMVPIYFSGCSEACRQAKNAIPWLETYSVDKPVAEGLAPRLRQGLAKGAVAAYLKAEEAKNKGLHEPKVFALEGPFEVLIELRDGEQRASKLRELWRVGGEGAKVYFKAETHQELYWQLIRLAYLKPWMEKNLGLCLGLMRGFGRLELALTSAIR